MILTDSATGSDSAASGAGPTTALTGTNGVSAADGLSVTLSTDNPDLSGVATDGSAVFYFADATAGNRNFSKITAVDNTLKIVTVANAFGLTLTKSWAIGGKRANVASTTSIKLLENNAANGDAMPGWVVEMQSGHSETIAATITIRRSGDTTTGLIELRGVAGAATLPLLTFSNNGTAFSTGSATSYWRFKGFEIQNSNATKTASTVLNPGSSVQHWILERIKVSHSTNKFWRVISGLNNYDLLIRDCEFGYCANSAITDSGRFRLTLENNWIHDCGAVALSLTSSVNVTVLKGNIISANSGDGVTFTSFPVDTGSSGILVMTDNTIDANTGDGVEITSSPTTAAFVATVICNNIYSNNGGYGLNLSHASSTAAALGATNFVMEGNCFYNNTSGKYNPSGLTNSGSEQTGDPTFTNSAGGDYSIGTNLKAKGYPLGGTLKIGTTSSTDSYVDIGAAQRQEAAASGTIPRHVIIPI